MELVLRTREWIRLPGRLGVRGCRESPAKVGAWRRPPGRRRPQTQHTARARARDALPSRPAWTPTPHVSGYWKHCTSYALTSQHPLGPALGLHSFTVNLPRRSLPHPFISGYWKYCTRFEGTPVYVLRFRLPRGFKCDRCILRWHYVTGEAG